MHYLMLVTISLRYHATSEDARCAVYDLLLRDESFCGSGGRFGHPFCDWFVIGGRWSGMIANTTIGEGFNAALIDRFPELAERWTPNSLADGHQAVFDAVWVACGGTGPSPYTRTGYEELGFEDDATPLTQQLYESHLAEYRDNELVKYGSHCEYVDLDGDLLQPDFVGRKWLVVVDYHC